MKKRLLALLLAVIMVTAVLASCTGKESPAPDTAVTKPEEDAATSTDTGGETDPVAQGDPYTVKMVLLGIQEPADLAKIEEKVNEILLPAINMTLDVEVMGFGAYAQQLPLMLTGGEKVDLVPVITNYAGSFVSQMQIVDLAPLLDQYGANITEAIGADKVTVASLDGFVYGIPTTGGWYTRTGFCMREDWLVEAGFTADDIKTIDDMEKIFAAVKEKHPDAAMFVPSTAMEDGRIETVDSLSDFNGVLPNYGQDDSVINYYASPDYEAYVSRMYDWAQKGWISKDAATNTEVPAALVKAGTAFSYPLPQSPGTAIQETISAGTPIVAVPAYDAFITTAGMTYLTWSIAQNSEDPVKAMQCLDYLYNSAEIMDLLNWGIEGEHYVANPDGTIGFANGLDAATSGYHLNQGWLLPRQFIGKIWEGNSPSIWTETAALNDSALKSKALGFRFDSTPVANQIAAISSVKGEYRAAFNSGSIDPATELPKYLEALETAGMSEVVAEKQAQYDTWKAAQ